MSHLKNQIATRMLRMLKLCPGTSLTDYVISSGCALALLDLRTSFDDIDLSVSAETFGRLVTLGYEVDVTHTDKPVIRFGSMNAVVHLDSNYLEKPLQTVMCREDVSLLLLTAEALLEEKEQLLQKYSRPMEKKVQDQKDIDALKVYIAQRNSQGEVSE